MLEIVVAGFIGSVLIAWVFRAQRKAGDEQEERRKRQRAQRIGLAPIPGADGKFQPRSLDKE